MQILYTVLTTFGSIIALFFLTKVIGNKQMSEMNTFDYINSITIGSIAAEMAMNVEDEFLRPLIAMIIYVITAWVISYIANHSVKFRRFSENRAILLMDNGKIYKHNFAKASLDLNAFLTQCRIQGYFDLADIQTAIWEANGKISILPKAAARPATPKDLKISPEQQYIQLTYILDGEILEENLQRSGKDINWLNKQLKEQKTKLRDIYLATDDGNNKLRIFTKATDAPSNDFFQ